jgi:hypothetical protein
VGWRQVVGGLVTVGLCIIVVVFFVWFCGRKNTGVAGVIF